MSERRSAFRWMAIAFVIGAVATGIVMGAIAFGLDNGFTPVEVVLFSIAVGCLVASFAALGSVWNSRATVDGIFASHPDDRRPVMRVVVRGKSETLTGEQQTLAARFAHFYSFLLPVQFAQSTLVIIAVGIIQVPNVLNNEGDVLVRLLFAFIIAAFIVAIVIGVLQYRNVSRYASAHPAHQTSAASPA